ncbi:MAG: TadE/TadG family type IV pilus assembly protein [Thermomicrobiales bacterium]
MFNLIPELHERRDERGQIVVLFGLLLVAIVAMVGLVLDGGSAFAQRRSQQNSSDLAAMAGANAFIITNDQTTARNAALQVSRQNGWEHGSDGVTVDVTIATTNGAEVTVVVKAPHENTFGSIVGLSTMNVATSATALSGFPDTAVGAGPMIFSVDAFDPDGKPKALYGNPNAPFAFGETNGDVPEGPGDLAWTNYGTVNNLNTSDVRDIIRGDVVITKTLDFGEYIGQKNNGNHTALYGEVNTYLSGTKIPVPIVDLAGNFQGWATFHVVSASGGSAKDVVGYFDSEFYNQRLTITSCANNDCLVSFGKPVLELVD